MKTEQKQEWNRPVSCRRLALSVGILAVMSSVGRGYEWRRDLVSVSFSAPPVLAYLRDLDGRRIGVDFSRTVSAFGLGSSIKDFEGMGNGTGTVRPPVGMVIQDNIANDDEDSPDHGKPQDVTEWNVVIMDGGSTTYELVYRGMESATSTIVVNIAKKLPTGHSASISQQIAVLVSPGLDRRVALTVDSRRQTISVVRLVTLRTLSEDLHTTCLLGKAFPAGICQSLSAKLMAAETSISKGSSSAARWTIKSFLNELSAQSDKHLVEPALSILRDEGEALLASLATPVKSPGRTKTLPKSAHQ